MKKLLLIIGVLLSINLPLAAAKEDVPLTIVLAGHDVRNTTVKRTPVHVPIEITYDDTTHVIEVMSEDNLDANVYILTEEGDVLGYSDCLNATLNVPAYFSGLLTISIESTEWTAVGEIEI